MIWPNMRKSAIFKLKNKKLEQQKKETALKTPVQIYENQIIVPVSFQSKGNQVEAKMLLDTGASMTSIYKSIADIFVIDRAKKNYAQVAGGSIIRTTTVIVDKTYQFCLVWMKRQTEMIKSPGHCL